VLLVNLGLSCAVKVDPCCFALTCSSQPLVVCCPLSHHTPGIILRYGLIAIKSKEWLDKRFMPWFGPCALLGLLYTIVVMFASQDILGQIGNVARVAVPMLIYFTMMFFASFGLSYWCKMSYEFSVTQVRTLGVRTMMVAQQSSYQLFPAL
jgi:ACR3 family arsenite efflux pump ArsB